VNVSVRKIVERMRTLDADAWLGLRPPYPPVALSVEADDAVLVRLKRGRRGRARYEAHARRPLEAETVPTSIFQTTARTPESLAASLRELFEASGTRPGRVSLVLPDNLAKISLLALPERPGSARDLEELVRARMRRAVPFRIEDARISHQLLHGEGRAVSVLVVLVRRALVEGLERAIESIGGRVGLVDVATSNLVNLCHDRLDAASQDGSDVALVNAAGRYFSLVIFRGGRLIFFRCKSLGEEGAGAGANGELTRELASSLSYYKEKLAGQGIGTLFARTVDGAGAVAQTLGAIEPERVVAIDPLAGIDPSRASSLDPELAQRLAPAIGAAMGRRH
jgi:Tfp pilus assembly PilM family ATPase